MLNKLTEMKMKYSAYLIDGNVNYNYAIND